MKHAFSSKLRSLLALMLALALMVSLTGCFQKENPEPSEEDPAVSQTDPSVETPTEAPVETEAPTEAPTEAVVTPPTHDIVKGTVAANNLNVRSNPSTDSTVLSQLPVDLDIDILEQRTVGDTNWGRIGEMTLPNGTKINGGWINLHYVKIAGESDPEPTTPSTGTQTGTQTGATGNGSTTVIAKGTITAGELNIRKGAGSTYDSIGKYIKGDKVEILEKKVVDGTTWGRTNIGWISLGYVKLDGSTDTSSTTNTGTNSNAEIESDGKTKVLGYGVVDLGSLNVRSGPGTKYDKVGTVTEGKRYAYYQKSGNWVRIEKGWVSASYFYLEGTTADDAVSGTITTDLNVRTGPGTDFKTNGSFKKDEAVEIKAQVNGWGYTSKGWISMKYVKTAAPTYTAGKYTVTTDLNIRKEAKADAEKVGSYKEGDKITVTEVKDGWGKTDKGWINMKYAKADPTYTTGKYIVKTDLNIRKDAKADSEKVGSYKEGEKITVTEVKDGWGKTDKGWINMQYVKKDTSTSTETGTNTTYKTGKATVKVNTTLTIRKEAKADGEKVGSYDNGTKVEITEVSGEWGKTDKGWINLKYVVYD